MPTFWLDSNVFLQAKNLYYAFDIAPGFWDVISEGVAKGIVRSPMMVYNELATGADDLADWANTKKRSGELFVEPDERMQNYFSTIADDIIDKGKFPSAEVALFLKGADLWVVACAAATEGIVVTHEKLVGADSKKLKVPNVCKQFGVEYVTCYEMLRRIGRPLQA
ncbi:MAG TPA: DUF4411 family protein [Bryobacteraceae bacterium]|nr:DUF4411 family protein [Bryobacteraceae bacterium]